MNSSPRFTVRLRFTKSGKIRFVSHRDVARIVERSIKKLRLPVSYSEGFSPRPRISFGLALTVAYESEAEFLDIDFVTPIDLEDLPARLSAALPDGLAVTAALPIEPGTASLQESISCCRWIIEVLGDPADVTAAVSATLEAPELMLERVRKGKTTTVDVRPSIIKIDIDGPTDQGVRLVTELATTAPSIRPAEFVRVLSPDFAEGRISRTHQFIQQANGDRFEPIEAPDSPAALQMSATSATPAEAVRELSPARSAS